MDTGEQFQVNSTDQADLFYKEGLSPAEFTRLLAQYKRAVYETIYSDSIEAFPIQ